MTTVDSAYLTSHAAEIAAAADRIAPYIRRTPLLTTDLDPQLRLKPESFQVTGSFKIRGAFNAVLQLKRREPDTKGVIAASSGNHAQALALAARTLGLPAVILIPADANPIKVAATRANGAEVIQDGISFSNREERLREEAEGRGLTIVHPYDNWDIIHGAGTTAAEALADDAEIRTVVTPVGGGGLLTGSVLAAKSRDPRIRVIGVEPRAADDARRTFETGTIQRLPADPQTLADGVRTMSIGRRNFEVMVEHHLLDDIVTLTEDEIAEGTVAAWLRAKLALEPTGALALSAWLAGKIPSDGPIALILSGGNSDPAKIATLLQGR